MRISPLLIWSWCNGGARDGGGPSAGNQGLECPHSTPVALSLSTPIRIRIEDSLKTRDETASLPAERRCTIRTLSNRLLAAYLLTRARIAAPKAIFATHESRCPSVRSRSYATYSKKRCVNRRLQCRVYQPRLRTAVASTRSWGQHEGGSLPDFDDSHIFERLTEIENVFDFFALLYDYLGPRFAEEHDLPRPTPVIGRFVRHPGQAPADLVDAFGRHLESGADEAAIKLAWSCIRAIDQMSAYVNPYTMARSTREMESAFRRWANRLRSSEVLNTRAVPGMVLFKAAPTARWKATALRMRSRYAASSQRGQWLRYQVKSLQRVPPQSKWLVDYARVNTEDDVQWSTSKQQIRVAVVPLAEETGDAIPTIVRSDGNRHYFDVALSDETLLARRGAACLRFADQELRSDIVVFPEAIVPSVVRSALQNQLDSCKHVQLVVAGSGAYDRSASGRLSRTHRNFNVASVLTKSAANPILVQSKMHPYDIHDYEQVARAVGFPAEDRRPWRENISRELRLVIRDSRIGRIGVLICEDFVQSSPEDLVADFGLTWLFVPVMAGSLHPASAFATKAESLCESANCTVVIANSAGIARAASDSPVLSLVGTNLFRPDLKRFTLPLDDPGTRNGTVLFASIP